MSIKSFLFRICEEIVHIRHRAVGHARACLIHPSTALLFTVCCSWFMMCICFDMFRTKQDIPLTQIADLCNFQLASCDMRQLRENLKDVCIQLTVALFQVCFIRYNILYQLILSNAYHNYLSVMKHVLHYTDLVQLYRTTSKDRRSKHIWYEL